MSLNTMQDLLVHELRDLISAEKQLVKALPKMAKAAGNASLARAITDHLRETEGQVERLEQCFSILDVSSRGKKCKGMEGLIEEGSEVATDNGDDDVRDAAIIGAAQRVEHYEMAAYGTARAFAERLGHADVAALLTESLEEEAAADKKLTELAESEINYEARTDGASRSAPKEKRPRSRSTTTGRERRAAL